MAGLRGVEVIRCLIWRRLHVEVKTKPGLSVSSLEHLLCCIVFLTRGFSPRSRMAPGGPTPSLPPTDGRLAHLSQALPGDSRCAQNKHRSDDEACVGFEVCVGFPSTPPLIFIY